MTDLFTFLKGFFEQRRFEQNKIPFLHEAIDVKTFPIVEMEEWKSKKGYQKFSELINSVYRDYYITGKKQTKLKSISIMDTSHSSGWYLQCNKLNFAHIDYHYLAFSLTMKMKELDYTIQVAELKSVSKSEGIEMITHYYLKPSLKIRIKESQDLSNQLFGNISIEYKTINGEPRSFKFFAKAYLDSNYSPPLEFHELNSILFND